MPNFYDKKSRERIEMINQALNMKHRSQPYDFTNIEDIKDAFMYTVAEFMDFKNYSSELGELLEKYDESMEYYYPVTWLDSIDDKDKHDRKVQKAYSSLRKACDDMQVLADRSEKEVIKLIRHLLSGNKEFRIDVFGKAYIYDDAKMSEIIDSSYEILNTYSVEESRDTFIELMDAHFDVED